MPVRRRRRHARAVRPDRAARVSRARPRAGEHAAETMFSEVCGTDVHLWHGRLRGVPYPIIPGHVSVGASPRRAARLPLADGHQAREGDRIVFFDVHRTCGRCYACAVSGTPTKCARARSTASPTPPPTGCLAAGAKPSISSPGWWPRAARQRDPRGLHRRRLRPDHRRACHRSRRDPAGRPRDGAGDRRCGPEHHCPRAPVRRLLGRRDRRPADRLELAKRWAPT